MSLALPVLDKHLYPDVLAMLIPTAHQLKVCPLQVKLWSAFYNHHEAVLEAIVMSCYSQTGLRYFEQPLPIKSLCKHVFCVQNSHPWASLHKFISPCFGLFVQNMQSIECAFKIKLVEL